MGEKIYSKNNNEYTVDGKRYVEIIRKCSCKCKKDGVYELECGIKERGINLYTYQSDADFILKYSGDKTFYLSPEAKAIVQGAVSSFDDVVSSRLDCEKYKKICVPELGLEVFYSVSEQKRGVGHIYNVILDMKDEKTILLKEDCTVAELMRFIVVSYIGTDKNKIAGELFGSGSQDIMLNPVYRNALSSGDDCLAAEIRVYCHKDTKEDCVLLSELFNVQLLPRLSEEYNKNYVVESDSVDMALILRSGYTILHRPYFAMQGCTNKSMQLNPCTKTGVDAAPAKTDTITFLEYLKLFQGS